MVNINDRLPDATFHMKDDQGNVNKVTTDDLFAGKKVILVGVPGAFTSTCHKSHIPTFVAASPELKAKGIDQVVVMSNNDHHVMRAWQDSFGGVTDGIHFVADGSSEFGKKLGLLHDASTFGMGIRYDRFAMVVDNGVVKQIHREPNPGKVTVSGASSVIEKL
jgi:peroxiredoxin